MIVLQAANGDIAGEEQDIKDVAWTELGGDILLSFDIESASLGNHRELVVTLNKDP